MASASEVAKNAENKPLLMAAAAFLPRGQGWAEEANPPKSRPSCLIRRFQTGANLGTERKVSPTSELTSGTTSRPTEVIEIRKTNRSVRFQRVAESRRKQPQKSAGSDDGMLVPPNLTF
jgi:hypothetical protein